MLLKISKKISRKNLYKLIKLSFDKILNKKDIKVLNIGAGGEIKNFIKTYFSNVFEIDIDKKRNPDQVLDLCSDNFGNNLKYNPNLVCAFEVLEHTTNPQKAVYNIYNIMEKNSYFLASVPFIFHIHDEPCDYFRFTKYGLKFLFKDFSQVKIYERNGWLETIFVLILRLEKESNLRSKILGKIFIVISFLITPLLLIIQKIFPSTKITTGYYIEAKK